MTYALSCDMPLTVKQSYVRGVDTHRGFAGNCNSVTWATLTKLPPYCRQPCTHLSFYSLQK